MEMIQDILIAMWNTLGEMAPYLLLGFLVAGILSVFISTQWIQRHLGGKGLIPTIKASLFGVPMPLCSCSVIPVTASIRKSGASKGATTSFLASTPETGVDSFLVTYALLGPFLAITRIITAMFRGILSGVLVSAFDRETEPTETSSTEENCPHCQSETSSADSSPSLRQRIRKAIHHGFVMLPRELAVPLFIGIVLAGIISGVMEKNAFQAYLGGGFASLLVMLAVSTPFYVCSVGSIPLAIGFLHLGASPGSVLVFLIAGPATNAATIAAAWNMLGRRSTLIYVLTVFAVALGAGALIDYLSNIGWSLYLPETAHEHLQDITWWHQLSSVVLLVLMFQGYFRKK